MISFINPKNGNVFCGFKEMAQVLGLSEKKLRYYVERNVVEVKKLKLIVFNYFNQNEIFVIEESKKVVS